MTMPCFKIYLVVNAAGVPVLACIDPEKAVELARKLTNIGDHVDVAMLPPYRAQALQLAGDPRYLEPTTFDPGHAPISE